LDSFDRVRNRLQTPILIGCKFFNDPDTQSSPLLLALLCVSAEPQIIYRFFLLSQSKVDYLFDLFALLSLPLSSSLAFLWMAAFIQQTLRYMPDFWALVKRTEKVVKKFDAV
jgi:hypothetical protein